MTDEITRRPPFGPFTSPLGLIPGESFPDLGDTGEYWVLSDSGDRTWANDPAAVVLGDVDVAQERAAYIMDAVNMHEALIAALATTLYRCSPIDGGRECSVHGAGMVDGARWACLARGLITKAGIAVAAI